MTSMKKAKQLEIRSIVFHYNDNGIYGIKTTYDVDGKQIV